MTPEERNLVAELFDRLATLEGNPRDPAAERAILEGLRQAPNGVYALVQTVLVQDEALKRADARIRELEGGSGAAPRDGSFLDGLRDTIFGREEPRRAGSVPSVKPGAATEGVSSAWRNTGVPAAPPQPAGQQYASEPARGGMGSSFLGTAAAAAAGVVGGSLLMSGISSMMRPGHGQAQAAFDPGARDTSPWSGGSSGGDLSRQAGLDDMGRAPGGYASGDGGRRGLFDDSGTSEAGDPAMDAMSGDDGNFDTGDFGGGDGGGD